MSPAFNNSAMLICFEYLKHTKYKAYDRRKKFPNRFKISLLFSKSLLFKCQISTKNNELSRLSCQFVSVSVQKVSFINILYYNTCDWIYVYFLQVLRNFTILTVTERNQLDKWVQWVDLSRFTCLKQWFPG